MSIYDDEEGLLVRSPEPVDPNTGLMDSSSTGAVKGGIFDEDKEFYAGNRGVFGDLLSSLYQGTIHMGELTGKGIEQVTGIDTGVSQLAEALKDTDLAKQDAERYWQEEDSWTDTLKDTIGGIIPSMVPIIAGGKAGALAGSLVAPGAGTAIGAGLGALGAMGLVFGAGSYKSDLDQNRIDHPEWTEEERVGHARVEAATELGYETLGTGLSLATGGIAGGFMKSGKGVMKQGLKNLISSGSISADELVAASIASKGKSNILKAILAGGAMDGATEVATEIHQIANDRAYGINRELINPTALFVGSMIPGGTMAGYGHTKAKQHINRLEKGLNAGLSSESEGTRLATATAISNRLQQIDEVDGKTIGDTLIAKAQKGPLSIEDVIYDKEQAAKDAKSKAFKAVTEGYDPLLADAGIDTSQDVKLPVAPEQPTVGPKPIGPQEAPVAPAVEPEDLTKIPATQLAQKRTDRIAKAQEDAAAEEAARQEEAKRVRLGGKATYQEPTPLTEEEKLDAYEPELPYDQKLKVRRDERKREVAERLEKKEILKNLEKKEEVQPEDPEWIANREKVRKAKAAAAIEEQFPTYPKNIAAKAKRDAEAAEAAEKNVKQEAAKVKKAQGKAKGEKNLAEKKRLNNQVQAAKDRKAEADKKLKQAKELAAVTKKQASEVAQVEAEIAETEAKAEARAKDLEAKTTAEQESILGTFTKTKKQGGWDGGYYTVNDKRIDGYEDPDSNAKIFKQGDRVWILVDVDPEGNRKNRGVFFKLGDAQLASKANKTAEEWYGKKEKKKTAVEKRDEAAPLTEEQEDLIRSLDRKVKEKGGNVRVIPGIQTVVDTAIRASKANETAESIIVGAIVDAARKFDPNTKTKSGRPVTFRSYANGRAIGAARDFMKSDKSVKHEVAETAVTTVSDEGQERSAISEAASAGGTVVKVGKKEKDLTKAIPVGPAKELDPAQYMAEKKAKEEADKKKKEAIKAEKNLAAKQALKKEQEEAEAAKKKIAKKKTSVVEHKKTARSIEEKRADVNVKDSNGQDIEVPEGATVKSTKVGKKIIKEIKSFTAKVFHGTPNITWEGEWKEGRPIFMTTDKAQAGTYAGKKGRIKEATVELKNPFVIDFKGTQWGKGPKGVGSAMQIAKRVDRDVYDGILYLNIIDPGPHEGAMGYDRAPTTQVAVFSNKTIKTEKRAKPKTLIEKQIERKKKEKTKTEPLPKTTGKVTLRKSSDPEMSYTALANIDFNGKVSPSTIDVWKVGKGDNMYWGFSITSDSTTAEVNGTASTLKDIRGSINDIIKNGTKAEEYGRKKELTVNQKMDRQAQMNKVSEAKPKIVEMDRDDAEMYIEELLRGTEFEKIDHLRPHKNPLDKKAIQRMSIHLWEGIKGSKYLEEIRHASEVLRHFYSYADKTVSERLKTKSGREVYPKYIYRFEELKSKVRQEKKGIIPEDAAPDEPVDIDTTKNMEDPKAWPQRMRAWGHNMALAYKAHREAVNAVKADPKNPSKIEEMRKTASQRKIMTDMKDVVSGSAMQFAETADSVQAEIDAVLKEARSGRYEGQLLPQDMSSESYTPEELIALQWMKARGGSQKALDAIVGATFPKDQQETKDKVIKILEEDIARRAVAQTDFQKKYPDGLAVLTAATKSFDKVTGRLAKFLLDTANFDRLTEIKVVLGDRNSYNPRSNTITLKEGAKPSTMLHEVVHGLTSQVLLLNTEESKALRGKVKKLMKIARAHAIKKGFLTKEEAKLLTDIESSADFKVSNLNKSNETRLRSYGFLNEREFLSEAFSNPIFQDFLKTVKLPGNKKSNTLWKRFVNWVGDVLKIDSKDYTVLEELILLTPEISNFGRDQAEVLETEDYSIDTPTREDKKPKTRADQVAIMKKNDLRDKPVDQLADWGSKAGKFVKDVGKGVTERIRKIDHTLIKPLRDMEFGILEDNKKYQDQIKDFVTAYNKMSKEDKLMLDLTLMNREPEDLEERGRILRKYKMESAYKKVEGVLQAIHKDKGKVGLNNYKDVAEYFPRRVKDVRALMQTIKDDPTYNVIQAELDRLGEDATQADKENAIQQMINTGRFPALAMLEPSSSKRRTIKRVSSEWKHHYDNSVDALVNHIYESNEAIHARRLFGDNYRNKRVQQRDKWYKDLESLSPETAKKTRAKLVSKILSIEAELEDYDSEWNNGISSMLLKKAPELTGERADTVIRLIRARLAQKGMHGPMASIRNVALMSVLSSPTSAITQIGDLAFSIYRYGPTDTVKAILGDKLITSKDLDLTGSMKEFQQTGSAKWLDKTLKWSGLQVMDTFGKNTTMQASLLNARKMTRGEFREKFGDYYGEDTDRTYDDIKANKNTEFSRFFAFNELSEYQPVSMSEMPLKYLESGNGRIMYALKSYNIKALNVIYRESVHKWRTSKTPKGKAKAAADVGRLVLLMAIAGATADELKDFLLGKDAGSFSDSFYNNLLKMAFMSRYTLEQGANKGMVDTLLTDILAPPMGFIDDPIRDMYSLWEGKGDFRTLQNLPWGKLPYNWFSDVAESKDMRKVKESFVESYSGGKSMSSIRSEMNKYNAWARKNDESLVTFKTLTKARKKKREEDRS